MKKLLFTMLTMLLPIIAAAELSEDSPLTSVDYNEASYSAQYDLKNTGEAPVEISINVTNFPDENFRNYLLEQDYGKDGVLTEAEIEGITSIVVYQKEISSLKGIEYFTAMRRLECPDNQLTALDLSKNTTLVSLSCYNNQLTALDVSKNTALKYLYCYNNQLTTLDVSKNTALTELSFYNNQLTALDVSMNTALTELSFYNNQLTALDVSMNTALTELNCNNNQLSALDVSKNTALKFLYCHHNQLTALDVSNNTALKYLHCHNNQLTELDVSKNTALKSLLCLSNQLTALDVSKNTALTSLSCGNNPLTALNVSKNTALTELWCDNNQLTALDVSKNTALTSLSCGNNPLTALNVSKNTALVSLLCYRNNIKGEAMTALINSLPKNTSTQSHYFRAIYTPTDETNTLTKSQVVAVKAKGWIPQYYDSVWKEYEGSDDTPDEDEPTDISTLSDAIYINSFSARVGESATMEICLKNAEDATAYFFDLVLPEGITVAKNESGKYIDTLSDRHDDHSRTFNYKGNNIYSLATLSGNSELLTGHDGTIRILTLEVADDLPEGNYVIEIKNASYSTPTGYDIMLPETKALITVEDYILGDVNGNDRIDIGDAVTIVNYLVGKESTKFVEKAADTNKNGRIDIGDAVTIVNVLVGKATSFSRTIAVEQDEREPQ